MMNNSVYLGKTILFSLKYFAFLMNFLKYLQIDLLWTKTNCQIFNFAFPDLFSWAWVILLSSTVIYSIFCLHFEYCIVEPKEQVSLIWTNIKGNNSNYFIFWIIFFYYQHGWTNWVNYLHYHFSLFKYVIFQSWSVNLYFILRTANLFWPSTLTISYYLELIHRFYDRPIISLIPHDRVFVLALFERTIQMVLEMTATI